MGIYRRVRIFAVASGSMSWRYVDSIILTSGEIVVNGYYMCNNCRSITVITKHDTDKQLPVCDSCTPLNSEI